MNMNMASKNEIIRLLLRVDIPNSLLPLTQLYGLAFTARICQLIVLFVAQITLFPHLRLKWQLLLLLSLNLHKQNEAEAFHHRRLKKSNLGFLQLKRNS